MDCSLPSSSVHGIFQARIMEWIAMPSSGGSSRLGDRTCVSYVHLRLLRPPASLTSTCTAGGFCVLLPIYLWSRVTLSALRWELEAPHFSRNTGVELWTGRAGEGFVFMSVSLGSLGYLARNSRQLTSPPLFSPCFPFSSTQLSSFSSSSSFSHFLIHPLLFPPCLPLSYPRLPLSSSFSSVSPLPTLSVFLSSSFYFCKYHVIFQINTKNREDTAINPRVFITEPQQ